MSAIASDSSYAEKLQPKELEDSENSDGTVKIKKQQRTQRNRAFGTMKTRDNLNQTENS